MVPEESREEKSLSGQEERTEAAKIRSARIGGLRECHKNHRDREGDHRQRQSRFGEEGDLPLKARGVIPVSSLGSSHARPGFPANIV